MNLNIRHFNLALAFIDSFLGKLGINEGKYELYEMGEKSRLIFGAEVDEGKVVRVYVSNLETIWSRDGRGEN